MESVRSNGPLGGAFLKPRPLGVVDYSLGHMDFRQLFVQIGDEKLGRLFRHDVKAQVSEDWHVACLPDRVE